MKKILIIILIIILMPCVSAYNWCKQEGYEWCVEQTELIKGVNITSKIAINLYDDTGDSYGKFVFSGFAVKGFYADIYYEGDNLYYVTNLTNWKDACDNETGVMICKGNIMWVDNNKITLKLGNLNDEYIGCPLFISVKCDDKVNWCEWAGLGFLKPENNTCPHIRVVDCYYDEDCLPNQYCNNPDKYDWKKRTCTELTENMTTENRTTRNNTRGYTNTAHPSAGGYSPQYGVEDIHKSLIDIIINIIRGIGQWFGGK